MTKIPEVAEGYISFYFNASSGKWSASLITMPPGVATGMKYYKVQIPVPEELITEQLPKQDQIKVSK